MAQTFHADCFLYNSHTAVPLYILLPEKYTLRSKSSQVSGMEWPFTDNFCYKRLEGDKPLTGYAATNLPMQGMLLVFMNSKCVHSPIRIKSQNISS